MPYGGVSAGALLTAATCTLSGNHVQAAGNAYWVHLKEEGDLRPLTLGPGLGFLTDCSVEVHVAEWGALPRLLAAMEQSGAGRGLGMDEPICLEVRDGAAVRVHGRGRAWLARATGPRRFQVEVLEPGERALL